METLKKKILITGASSGLGRELAYQFAQKGNVELILVARRKEALEKVVKKCHTYDSVKAKSYSVDIGAQDQVEGLLEKIDDVDILINAAGYGIMKDFSEFTDYEVVKMFDTNVIGTIQLTTEIAKRMRENKSGSIVTIASLAGKIATPKTSVYSATKAGLSQFSKSLFEEVRKNDVKVITIYPDMTKTNFYENNTYFECDDDEKAYIKMEDVGNTIEFILNQSENIVFTDITIKPQRHKIKKVKRKE